jgi:hypothetical protein
MPLQLDRLLMAKRLFNGVVVAQCPACAEVGQDHDGNHLKVLPDGRYCCVVFPGKDGKEHRRAIFRLAGVRSNSRPPIKFVYTLKVRPA